MLNELGERIRLARLRRQVMCATICGRSSLSPRSLHRVEAGHSGMSLAMYLRVMACLGLSGDFDALAADDKAGRRLQVLSNLAKALSIRGTLALVGAARPGTEAPFEIGQSLVRGWSFKTIVQGSSVPQEFTPRLVSLWQQGRFPVERVTRQYKFDDINQAFADSESGAVVKPVVV
jgi:Zn-dependent alcohol dehydrogenase